MGGDSNTPNIIPMPPPFPSELIATAADEPPPDQPVALDHPYTAGEELPVRTRISVLVDDFHVYVEWPDSRRRRRLTLRSSSSGTGELLLPASLSPLVSYRVVACNEGNLLRLVPLDPARFVTEPVTARKLLDATRCVLAQADSGVVLPLLCEVLGRYAHPQANLLDEEIDRETLGRLLLARASNADADVLLARYMDRVLDWLRWRLTGIEADIAYLTQFLDGLCMRLSAPDFCVSVPGLASDLRHGRNVLAHHLSGVLSLEEIARWIDAVPPELSAPLEFGGAAGAARWQTARGLFDAWSRAYSERGPYLDGPRSAQHRPVYEFFVRQGVFFDAPEGEQPQTLMLELVRWHEAVITEFIGRLIELSDQRCFASLPDPESKTQKVSARAVEHIPSFLSLVNEKLCQNEVVIIDHPCDTALDSLIEPLANISTWMLLPGSDQLPNVSRSYVRPAGRMPNLILVRAVHFWTVKDLATLLRAVYYSPARALESQLPGALRHADDHDIFPKLVIEGDFRAESRTCRVLKRAAMYHLGKFNRPVNGIYNWVDWALLNPPSRGVIPERRNLVQSLITLLPMKRRPAETFQAYLRERPAESSPLRWVKPGAPLPAGVDSVYTFDSIATLMQLRRDLPLPSAIYVPVCNRLKNFEELYFLFRATLSLLILEANCEEELLCLFV